MGRVQQRRLDELFAAAGVDHWERRGVEPVIAIRVTNSTVERIAGDPFGR